MCARGRYVERRAAKNIAGDRFRTKRREYKDDHAIGMFSVQSRTGFGILIIAQHSQNCSNIDAIPESGFVAARTRIPLLTDFVDV